MDFDFTSSGSSTAPLDIDFTGSLTGAAPQSSPPAQLLGFVVPGGPVRTDFVPTDASGTKYTLTLRTPGDLPLPLTAVSEVVCFLLPNAPLPPQHGILLYWQISSPGNGASTGFELLGAITQERPSAIFRTSWSQNEILLSQHQISPVVTLGVSIEPLENIQNVDNSGNENRLHVAQKIAMDLFQFMQSFDTGAVGNMMTVPTNIFDKWMKRFETRFRRDPSFFMKNE